MATSSQIADITCCAICLETFTRPKMLPCQHTYCYSCVLSLGDETTKTIICPQCREVHKFPKEGVIGFKDNIMANNLLGICPPKEESLCVDCKLKPAVSPCEHCQADMCVTCIVEHVKLSMELKMSLNEAKESISAPKTSEKLAKLAKARRECSEQLEELTTLRNKRLAHLFRSASSLKNFMEVIVRVYDDVLQSSDVELSENSYLSSLSGKADKCTTAESLRCLKYEVSDLKNVARLLQRMDGGFKFVPRSNDSFGHIEIGQLAVEVEGNYATDGSVGKLINLLSELEVWEKNADFSANFKPHEGENNDPRNSTGAVGSKVLPEESKYVFENPVEIEHVSSPQTGNDDKRTRRPWKRVRAAIQTPLVSISAPVPAYNQNQLPENVDYRTKGKGWIPVIRHGRTVDSSVNSLRPYGVAFHVATDLIYVADHRNNRIMVFNSDGSNARVFFNVASPCNLAIATNGAYLYIAAAEAGLTRIDLNDKRVKVIKKCSFGNLEMCGAVACHKGYTILLDNWFNCVFVYGADDREIRHFGGKVLTSPQFIGISKNGTMYITDQRDIEVFSWDGQHLYTFLSPGRDYTYGQVAIDGDGYVCVANLLQHCVEVYDPHNNRVATISGPGKRPGRLVSPFALCFMPDGKLIVAERDNNRLQIF